MASPDLILLHPPSVYDFRHKTILYGPISDLIPSTPIFEMYPIGFMSIAEYLEQAGYRVRVTNLAAHMLNDRHFDASKLIRSLQPKLFGIDLHWLPHAQGAVEVARLAKKHHPNTAVVMGGLSASYYYNELLMYPEIDYVIRGDSAEEPLRRLLDCVTRGGEPAEVPNLAWRDAQGVVHENPLSHVPASLDDVMVNHYDSTVRSVIRYRDFASYIPFMRWLRYPITAVLTCRGCTQNCAFCGGSAAAFQRICHRDRPAFRSPEAVVRDVKRIQHITKGPIFVIGDIRQPGDGYADRLLWLLDRERPKNQLIFELFTPASAQFLRRLGRSCPGFCLEVSLDSYDPAVRTALGKHYSTKAMEETMIQALAAGCRRLDVFFMIGLPQQTYASVMDTIDYCGQLMDLGGQAHRLAPFISPLAPFLDPGSLAFEDPQRYGYRILFRTLEEHRRALESPSWKYMLNYETRWLRREDIVTSTYEAGLRLNRLKAQRGSISKSVAEATEGRMQAALHMLHRIDRIVAVDDNAMRERELAELKGAVDGLSMSTVCEKTELELPLRPFTLNPWSALKALLTGP